MTVEVLRSGNDVTVRHEGQVRPESYLIDLSAAHGLPRPTESWWRAPDGMSLRYAHWQTPGPATRGAVLYLNGRTEFIEKTVELYGLIVRSGFDLWTFDWRGQGLSTRALADPHKGHVSDYQIYLDDLDQFVHEITDLPIRRDRKLMLAHSMGGHIGLRYLHDRPGILDRAAFSAPMIDIPANHGVLRGLNRLIMCAGWDESYALGTGRFRHIFNNPADPTDNGTVDDYRRLADRYDGLSSDARKRRDVERLVRENPTLALGGPTSAWLDATFQSIGVTWSSGYAERILTPVLMIGGGRDRTVVMARQRQMCGRLPKGRFLLIDQAAHELFLESDDILRIVLEAINGWAGIEIALPDPP